MEICTIGTSGITAERFFGALSDAGVSFLVDTRLHPNSQLTGYAKQDSLIYFLDKILGIGYRHEPLLTPSDEKLKKYRSKTISWETYAEGYSTKLKASNLRDNIYLKEWGDRPVLLCSESTPKYCHRRLAAEYLKEIFPNVKSVNHLGQ